MNFNELLKLTSKIEQNNSLVVEAYSEPGFKARLVRFLKSKLPDSRMYQDFYTDQKIEQIVDTYTGVLDSLNAAGNLPADQRIEKLGKMYQVLRLKDTNAFGANVMDKLYQCNLADQLTRYEIQMIEGFVDNETDYGKFELPRAFVRNSSEEGKTELIDNNERTDTAEGIFILRDEEVERLERKIATEREKLTANLRERNVPDDRIPRIVDNQLSKLNKEVEKYNRRDNESTEEYIRRLTNILEKPQLSVLIDNQIKKESVYTTIVDDFENYLDTHSVARVTEIIACLFKDGDPSSPVNPESVKELFSFEVYNKPHTVFYTVGVSEQEPQLANHVLEILERLYSDIPELLEFYNSAPTLQASINQSLTRAIADIIDKLHSNTAIKYKLGDALRLVDKTGVYSDYAGTVREYLYLLRDKISGFYDLAPGLRIQILDKLADYLTEDNFKLGKEIKLLEVKPAKDILHEIYKPLKLVLDDDSNIERQEKFEELYKDYPGATAGDPEVIVNNDQILILRALTERQAVNAREKYIEPITGCPGTGGRAGRFRFGWCVSSRDSNIFDSYRYNRNYTQYFVITKPDYYIEKKLRENPAPADETPEGLRSRVAEYKEDYCGSRYSAVVVQRTTYDNFLVTGSMNNGDAVMGWEDLSEDIPELNANYNGRPIRELLIHVDAPPREVEKIKESKEYSNLPYVVKNHKIFQKEWIKDSPDRRYLTVEEFISLKDDDVKRLYMDTRPHVDKSGGYYFKDPSTTYGIQKYSSLYSATNTDLSRNSRQALIDSGNGKYLKLMAVRYNNYPRYGVYRLKKGSYDFAKHEHDDDTLPATSFVGNHDIFESLPQLRVYVRGTYDVTKNDFVFKYIDENGFDQPIDQLEIYQPTKEELAVEKSERPLYDAEIMQDIYDAAALIKVILKRQ